MDFAINEKCAAGTGTFVEAMSRALEVSVDEMSKITLQSTQTLSTNAQCAVFGESEVVSLIHQKTPKPDIARAVMNAIAGRVASVARIVGLEKDVVMVGGMAKNAGFVDSLKKNIDMNVVVLGEPGLYGGSGRCRSRTRRDHDGRRKKWRRKTKNQDFWRWPETNWVNPDTDWKKGKVITARVI